MVPTGHDPSMLEFLAKCFLWLGILFLKIKRQRCEGLGARGMEGHGTERTATPKRSVAAMVKENPDFMTMVTKPQIKETLRAVRERGRNHP